MSNNLAPIYMNNGQTGSQASSLGQQIQMTDESGNPIGFKPYASVSYPGQQPKIPMTSGEYELFNIKTYLGEAIENTTLHGLASVKRAHNTLLRIIFLTIFLASFAYCFSQIISSFLTFFAYDISTTTKIEIEAPMEFPVVQICNQNIFDQVKAAKNLAPFVTNNSIDPADFATTMDYTLTLNNYFRFNIIKTYLNNSNALYAMSFDISQMLISCRFQNKNCTANDFMLFYDYYYGTCYRFNIGRGLLGANLTLETQGQAGWANGLQLELYAGSSEQQESYMVNRGFRLIVFNRSDIFQAAQEQGIDVPVGQATNVAVVRRLTNHMSEPYGKCLPIDINKIDWSQNPVLNFMYTLFLKGSYYFSSNGNWVWYWTLAYSRYNCLKMCYQKFLFETCSCYDVTLPKSRAMFTYFTQNACSNLTQLNCMNDASEFFYSSTERLTYCYDSCPIECNEIKYDLTLSSSIYPTEWYAKQLADNPSFNRVINSYFDRYNKTHVNYKDNYTALRDSVAKVNVFYDDLSYTLIEESPAMTYDVLIGTVGGNMGLFLGASILTLLEPIQVLMAILVNRCGFYWLAQVRKRTQNMRAANDQSFYY